MFTYMVTGKKSNTYAKAPEVTPSVAKPVIALPITNTQELGARALSRLPARKMTKLTRSSALLGKKL